MVAFWGPLQIEPMACSRMPKWKLRPFRARGASLVYIHIYIYIYIERERERYVCVSYVYIIHVRIYIYIYIYVYTYVYTYVYLHNIYIHIYTYIYIYIYIERERYWGVALLVWGYLSNAAPRHCPGQTILVLRPSSVDWGWDRRSAAAAPPGIPDIIADADLRMLSRSSKLPGHGPQFSRPCLIIGAIVLYICTYTYIYIYIYIYNICCLWVFTTSRDRTVESWP